MTNVRYAGLHGFDGQRCARERAASRGASRHLNESAASRRSPTEYGSLIGCGGRALRETNHRRSATWSLGTPIRRQSRVDIFATGEAALSSGRAKSPPSRAPKLSSTYRPPQPNRSDQRYGCTGRRCDGRFASTILILTVSDPDVQNLTALLDGGAHRSRPDFTVVAVRYAQFHGWVALRQILRQTQ